MSQTANSRKQTKAEKEAELKEVEEAATTEEQTAEVPETTEEQTKEENGDMNILEAIEYTERTGKPVARRAWEKITSKPELMFRAGETKPSYRMNKKHFSSYQPSIDDVMKQDWYKVEEE
jgi:hypothetical protein